MPEPTPQPPRFEQALSELERILRDLEDGTTSLEESLARYERGIGLLKHCYGQLRSAEQKIRQLSGVGEDRRRQGVRELRGIEHRQVFEHISRCTECSHEYESFLQMKRMLGCMRTQHPSLDLQERISYAVTWEERNRRIADPRCCGCASGCRRRICWRLRREWA